MKELEKAANRIRNKVLDMCISSGGHIVSSFSAADILTALYHGNIFKHDPKEPNSKDRDYFILSKGHGETLLYAVLNDCGYFPNDWIENHYRNGDCRLGGHPDNSIPGVEITSGALGHGLGISSGIALGKKINNEKNKVFVLMGDSECTEGSVWEAALFASKQELNNLIAIVDYNKIGSIDFTENFTSLDPFADKWKTFGWEVKEINGHDFTELLEVIQYAKNKDNNKPLMVVAHTVKGKGVSFMENSPIWHAKSLSTEEEILQAKKELEWEA